MKRFLLLVCLLLAACASSTINSGVDEVPSRATDTPGLPLMPDLSPPVSESASPLQPTQTPPPTPLLMERAPTEILFGCAVVRTMPANDTIFEPDTNIDIQFWLKNTGIRTWVSGLKLSYRSGGGIVTDVHHLLPEVTPGEEVGPFEFVMRSPLKGGTYTLQFQLGKFCFPFVRIRVER